MSVKVEESKAISLLNKMIKLAGLRNEKTKISYEQSTSYARYGRYDAWDVESAINLAKHFVKEKTSHGVSARVLVTVYCMTKDGWSSMRTVGVQSPFSGKYNSLGYAIPADTNEVEFIDWGC